MTARGLTLIFTTERVRSGLTELIAALILHGPLFVVSASEWLPAFELTRLIRRQTHQVRQTLNGLSSVRSSTCYRLLDSLAEISPTGRPILVIDFLHTFYDPDIPLPVRLRVLRKCCEHLQRLAFQRPVIVMTQTSQADEYPAFYNILAPIADKTLRIAPELEPVSQPALF
jgi:hypothetical protein